MRGQSDKNVSRKRPGDKIAGGERKRKAITLEEKLDVIKRFERNERTCDIVRVTGIKESTLRTIRDNAEKIKASYIAGTSLSASKSMRSRTKELEEMERLLSVWIEDQMKKQSGTTFLSIKEKALSIYEDLTKKAENPADVPAFSASSGWFAGFKNRYAFHNIKLCGKAANADAEHAMAFPAIVKLIDEEGHCEDLSTADLQQLVAEREVEAGDEVEVVQDAAPQELSTSVLSSILREIQKQLRLLEDTDYNAERSRVAVRGIRSYLAPYEKLLHEQRERANQQKLNVFSKPTPKKQLESNEPQSSTSGLTIFHPKPATTTAPESGDDDDPQSLH
ncbi:TP53-regulated inhibitor of apoptosis 1 isoform X1 [Stegostoma tigrinum]|uniref:TP53-regulated inhibitor of apoptosis 1 isoform X1 n=1 Tax=Stegostoma tigrinum TaxID=3053191 RepID=UPI00286FE262|nr:TP53-regulated inhibitor of apoptosis 1 isoform X1 [Stegostoma tigrinum]XP_059511091.1 TP53-regulated inhibitor of apoptosis 1 isoform X1 [Stegostoma tigrinum]XP_059511092.1 TP53-regulated inhibitor of apoptosis 1 isoform X1 [Stegostoma tigrinum]XP_059511093.1 TP53-regulated inhibitor of apoptosis 1 isoform X1 [Stegostoma tigrinum]